MCSNELHATFCLPIQNIMRSRMLELPLKPLSHKTFVGIWCSFVIAH